MAHDVDCLVVSFHLLRTSVAFHETSKITIMLNTVRRVSDDTHLLSFHFDNLP